MKVKEKILFPLLDQLKKKRLKKYLKASFHEMDDKQKREVFGEIYEEEISKGKSPKHIYSEIEKFHQKSLNGAYYAPFMINSKNYSNIPAETDEWFSELSYYLDESSKLVEKEKYEVAAPCFELLFELISLMEDGEDIVFADEYGTWMISSNSDYYESYIKLSSNIEDQEAFAEKMIPLLRRDSSESFTERIYSKIKKHANKDQLTQTDHEIETRKISIKLKQ